MASERNRYLDAAEQHWLWRAVDQKGLVLEVLIQRRRDSRAAQRLVKKALKFGATPPRVMIAYKPRSYGAARARWAFTPTDHRHHKALNHRAENSHPPTRRRERIIKRLKSSRQTQRFLSVHDPVANLFHVPYSGAVTADFRRASREPAFAISCEISAIGAIADSQTLRSAFFGSVPARAWAISKNGSGKRRRSPAREDREDGSPHPAEQIEQSYDDAMKALADYLTRERDAATTIEIQILDRDSFRDAITEVLVDARVHPRPRADVPEREL